MQLRRALPLSLVALLASAGCVSVGPRDPAPSPSPSPAPVRGSVPSADLPAHAALPLSALPPAAPPGPAPDQDRKAAADPDRAPGSAAPRRRSHAKQAAPPRRTRQPGTATAHPRRRPPPPRMDELCAAADGVVPPSIVDLCVRQYGR
ncbi:hypothetical protein [Streptomyces sp. NRRL F-2664]|uniref:hypothetical protein n=1 Tax=Streptomyces sp. NRRL F-2664 TaxID=1463842 RepID=UPI000A87C06B|nr:hypothetical protein [Streptomyces sp. NRRL F-2664]